MFSLLKSELANFQTKFEPNLSEFLDKQLVVFKSFNLESAYALNEVKSLALSGGKRLRPALVYFSYQTFAPDNSLENEATQVGLALELFHTFALIHDDIIDQAKTRRSVSTLEVKYTERFQSDDLSSSQSLHVGQSGAILGGDLAYMLAEFAFHEVRVDPKIMLPIQSLYYQMQKELIAGQIDDCFGVGLADLKNLDSLAIKQMIKLKSGNYSIQKPLLMGAILGAASAAQLQSLTLAGELLGEVFQIQDDILGLFGQEDKMGKSNTSDILEGKRTLLILETFQAVNQTKQDRIQRILGNKLATETDIIWLKNLVQETGVLHKLEQECQKNIDLAKAIFTENLNAPKNLDLWLEFCDYLFNRSI